MYCRTANRDKTGNRDEYLRTKLVHLRALPHRSTETLNHTRLSAAHMALRRRRFEVAIVCNSANVPGLPILRLFHTPATVHVDGLEWRRAKWGRAGRYYYRLAESLAVRWADALVADADGIRRYYLEEFGATSAVIPHGAPNIFRAGSDLLTKVGVEPHRYHPIVARFEPENHVDLIIEGYLRSDAQLPLVVVGSTPYPTAHVEHITSLASRSHKVLMLGGVWDQELLNQLYANALSYLHGHSWEEPTHHCCGLLAGEPIPLHLTSC